MSRTDWDPESIRRWWGTVKDREYYHRDILGSTALLTDKFAMVRERYRYDAFGDHYAGTFKRFNELGYTGKRYDGTTSLYDYGFRDYYAESGRFTTVDPIRDGSNWYAYCGNDPVNKVDLWGLEDIVVMFLLNQEDKDLNATLYNLVVDQSAMDLETAAAIAGKTIRVDRDATLDDITAAYEDGDTERLILVVHGYPGQARLSNIDNRTNSTGTITPSSFDPSKKGSELTDVDIIACYQKTTNANLNLEAEWEAGVGTNVNTYNPNEEPIHWNQTNWVLQDQIPSQIRGSEPLQPTMPAPNPVTEWLIDVVESGGTEDISRCSE